ncbi:MAG TPA: fused MFS/spermidine synthase, partial [Pyrinomonadaceae bacterium]|nr:fused MFS/spermidine synthase [Pyrinomonadaceae bacterium]
LFRLIDRVYAAAWPHFHQGFYGLALARFALAAIVLLIPTALMGATLPVLAGAVGASQSRRNSITTLYAGNLAGAIAGTIAAGFFLLPYFGVRATIWIAAATNLLIGVVAFLIDAKAINLDTVVEQDVDKELISTPASVAATGATFWLTCAVISGFVTISMQIVWSRILAMIIGSSTYAFSIVLALFLAGLALGAYLVSAIRNRDSRSLRRTVFGLEILTAAALFIGLPVANAVPALLVSMGLRLGVNSWTGLLTLQIAAAALLILVPATFMGMVMPLVLTRAGSARVVGKSYALNTVGAIAGALVTAFLLIPRTNTRFTILCVASLCLVVAGIAYQPRRARGDLAVVRSLSIGGAFALIIVMFIFWPALNLNTLSVGAYDSFVRVLAKSRGDVPEDDRNSGTENHQLLMFAEGRTATVSVRRDWGITSVAINGRTNASDGDDMPTQILLGQLGILAAPRLENSLVVGFATGVTPGSVLQSPIQSVDCVEIEPAAVASSSFFNHVNNRPLSDPRLHLITDDARSHLRVNPMRYDLIISEPSHPWVPGVANLFTREFFALGRERLQDNGVFVQWLQIYQLSTESLRSVLATFHEVFPHVAVFRVQGAAKGKDLILLGSRAPITFGQINQQFSDQRISAELARAGIKTPGDLRAWFVCDETQLGPAVAGAIINTDDNMHVETVAPREAFRPTMDENAAWIESLRKAAVRDAVRPSDR